jgi:hypothetical protein
MNGWHSAAAISQLPGGLKLAAIRPVKRAGNESAAATRPTGDGEATAVFKNRSHTVGESAAAAKASRAGAGGRDRDFARSGCECRSRLLDCGADGCGERQQAKRRCRICRMPEPSPGVIRRRRPNRAKIRQRDQQLRGHRCGVRSSAGTGPQSVRTAGSGTIRKIAAKSKRRCRICRN